MQTVTVYRDILKTEEGSYFTVPFSVPENTEKITVKYSYFKKGKGFWSDLRPSNTIDVGLCDEKGNFLGWSGSAHSEIFVGEHQSSPGYLRKPINAGEWQILAGAYHVMPQGVRVKYEITFEQKRERLLYGDLHMHSTASDGALSSYELAVKAKEQGLDFIGIADHNNYAENFHLPDVSGVTCVPAVEWTHYKGHMNFFGVKAPFDSFFAANSAEDMRLVISHARESGAVVSVNHPMDHFCPYLWEDDDAYDMMEIWNGPMRPANTKALEKWTELLRAGRKIPIVGGSDFHRPRSFAKLGNPVTGVYAASASAEDILNAVKNGRAFVCAKKGAARLDLSYGESKMGQTAVYSPDTPLVIKSSVEKLILVTADGEREISAKGGSVSVDPGDTPFAYVKVKSGACKFGSLRAVSNPIYFKKEEQS